LIALSSLMIVSTTSDCPPSKLSGVFVIDKITVKLVLMIKSSSTEITTVLSTSPGGKSRLVTSVK